MTFALQTLGQNSGENWVIPYILLMPHFTYMYYGENTFFQCFFSMENVIANHCNGVMFFDSLKLCSILTKNAKRYAWLIFHCLLSLWWKHHIFGLKRCAAFAEMGKKGQLWMDKLEQIYRAECPITIPDPIIWSFLLYLKSTWCLGRVDSLQS